MHLPMAKSPAFQFYPADFYLGTDEMSAAQVGGYIRLLCKQWDKNVLPFDKKVLKKWAGLSEKDLIEVLKKFEKMEDGYLNERLETERQKQEQYRVSKSEAGKIGNAKRWGNKSHSDNGATDVRVANGRSSSSTSSSTSVNKKETKVSKKSNPVLVMPDDIEPELWQRYLNLNEWLKTNAPNVLKLADQLTVYEYQKLAAKMHGTELAALLMKMHNWKDLAKKNVSVYYTANNWLNRDKSKDTAKGVKLDFLGRDISKMG